MNRVLARSACDFQHGSATRHSPFHLLHIVAIDTHQDNAAIPEQRANGSDREDNAGQLLGEDAREKTEVRG